MKPVELPLEVLDLVIEQLCPKDLLACRSVNRLWKFAVTDFVRRKAQLKRYQRSRLTFEESYAISRHFNKNILRNANFDEKQVFVIGQDNRCSSQCKLCQNYQYLARTFLIKHLITI
jgi:hypothetical protein